MKATSFHGGEGGDFLFFAKCQNCHAIINILQSLCWKRDQVGVVVNMVIGGSVWLSDVFVVGYGDYTG